MFSVMAGGARALPWCTSLPTRMVILISCHGNDDYDFFCLFFVKYCLKFVYDKIGTKNY